MKHRKKGKKLGLDKAHRKSLLNNLIGSLIFYEEVATTQAKAKEAARLAEKLITLAKNDSLYHRRRILRVIRNEKIAKKLFEVIAPRYQEHKGGYTQITRLRKRKGDNALICKVKLV
ncbi:50S ribosomal protein L17 [subsurface metagenome]